MIYIIYINNKQFTCLSEEEENEKNIPYILGFPCLTILNKEKNNGITELFYQLKDFINLKIYLNEKFVLEKLFPLSIPLKRLRDLLIHTINSNFLFSFNYNIIQIQEESSFCLQDIIKDDVLNLFNKEFIYIRWGKSK